MSVGAALPTAFDDARIRLGVSACLIGERVRYDGGHKRDRFVAEDLASHFELVPLCPELAIGLGAPRPPIRLEGGVDAPRAVIAAHGRDVTEALAGYGCRIGAAAGALSGYILKSRSPSCGMQRVKVYDTNGVPVAAGRGIYARALMAAQPLLPVEEEGRLQDAGLRDSFIERVLAYHRWQCLAARGVTAAALIAYHTEHKFLLMAHDQAAARALGRLVARCKEDPRAIGDAYIAGVLATLARPVRRGGLTNVLQHLAGFLKDHIDRGDRAELAAAIAAYQRGEVPILVPLTLLRHHLRRHPHPYLAGQRFVESRPPPLDTRR